MGGNWLQECIAEMNGLVRQPIRLEHQGIVDRARGYSFGVAGFLQKIQAPPERDHVDPRSVIRHYCAFIPPKIYRALTGLDRCQDDADDWPADHDGSAKVALIAIERSRAAWIAMAELGLAPVMGVEQFVSDLSRLADDLDRVFPNARAFVRPGLDEPDEVAKLS
jgi:hypothetical protein